MTIAVQQVTRTIHATQTTYN